ncbi:MAG: RNA binding methyltransferase FtsJ like [uncultured Acidimicrobiales bacterium]|uniref:RNA binding methyltransferase FtsJ like n=1 Tax=uncultured Acidimicrobiales bacterium TaxID=310071 RepID=A0A6J4I5C1_9ACTN|nr:MAG: RNA binding methyltransferase FtsJ like [uncultured Acidimicrobiales bacterium]
MRRGLAESRERAQADIAARRVLVAGSVATKAATQVSADQPIELLGPPPRYVSRGGEKLHAALSRFDVDPTGVRCIDAGASTGGFTDCLLQWGAAEVVAVDVGYGQLHERLRSDPRVHNLERTNVRSLTPEDVGGVGGVVVADLSFISLTTVAPALLGLLDVDHGHLVALVKPQFEAGRVEAARGKGVVRSPVVWRRVLGEVAEAVSSLGATMMGAMVSPLTGADGNVEFLVHVVPDGMAAAGTVTHLDAVVDEAVARHGAPGQDA